MKNTLTLGTVLLGCCLVAVGQTSGSSTSGTSPDQGAGYSQGSQAGAGYSGQSSGQTETSNKTSIRGCLTKAADGSFMLADFSGNTFQLSGDTSKLSPLVGQEVRVEGFQSSAKQAPGSMSSATSEQAQKQFSVSKVHKVASTCRATGGSAAPSSTAPSGGASNPHNY